MLVIVSLNDRLALTSFPVGPDAFVLSVCYSCLVCGKSQYLVYDVIAGKVHKTFNILKKKNLVHLRDIFPPVEICWSMS